MSTIPREWNVRNGAERELLQILYAETGGSSNARPTRLRHQHAPAAHRSEYIKLVNFACSSNTREVARATLTTLSIFMKASNSSDVRRKHGIDITPITMSIFEVTYLADGTSGSTVDDGDLPDRVLSRPPTPPDHQIVRVDAAFPENSGESAAHHGDWVPDTGN